MKTQKKMMKSKIIILSAMHKRPAISELFCMSALRLVEASKSKFDVRIYSLVSDDESEEICNRYNINVIRTVEAPLGRKMNNGIEEALALWDWDYLLQISDDDVVSSNLLDIYEPYIKNRVPYFGVKEIYFLDAIKWRAVRYKYQYNTDKLMGCGRMFLREAIEKTGWTQVVIPKNDYSFNGVKLKNNQPVRLPLYQARYLFAMECVTYSSGPEFMLYDDEQVRSLDWVSEYKMLFNGYHPVAVETKFPMLTDIKSTVNIWEFDSYRIGGEKVKPEEAMSFWSGDEKAKVKLINQRLSR